MPYDVIKELPTSLENYNVQDYAETILRHVHRDGAVSKVLSLYGITQHAGKIQKALRVFTKAGIAAECPAPNGSENAYMEVDEDWLQSVYEGFERPSESTWEAHGAYYKGSLDGWIEKGDLPAEWAIWIHLHPEDFLHKKAASQWENGRYLPKSLMDDSISSELDSALEDLSSRHTEVMYKMIYKKDFREVVEEWLKTNAPLAASANGDGFETSSLRKAGELTLRGVKPVPFKED